MPIFIPISCLKINPQVICTEVGDRWRVLGQRQAMVAGREGQQEEHSSLAYLHAGMRHSRLQCGERKRFCGLYTKNTVTAGDACVFWLFGLKGASLSYSLLTRSQCRMKF